jgi:hypothetical protein
MIQPVSYCSPVSEARSCHCCVEIWIRNAMTTRKRAKTAIKFGYAYQMLKFSLDEKYYLHKVVKKAHANTLLANLHINSNTSRIPYGLSCPIQVPFHTFSTM